MKTVEYNGPSIGCLGRFGKVSKGDRLTMFEWEYDSVSGDKNYSLLGKKPSQEELEIASRVKPIKCSFADLSMIDWSDKNLYSKMCSRMSKPSIVRVFQAINYVGGHIEHSSVYDTKDVLIDRIIEAIRYMGWDKLTEEDRAKIGGRVRGVPVEVLPTTVDATASVPKITRHRERKRVEP
jgi:hypothetical protein